MDVRSALWTLSVLGCSRRPSTSAHPLTRARTGRGRPHPLDPPTPGALLPTGSGGQTVRLGDSGFHTPRRGTWRQCRAEHRNRFGTRVLWPPTWEELPRPVKRGESAPTSPVPPF